MRLNERLAFLREFREQFATTGAIQPSSRYLARAMTAPLRSRRSDLAVRIVEMGPGTGAVTRAIAATMRPGDMLECFELNPQFASFLRGQVASAACYERVRDAIVVHAGDAAQATIDTVADYVICSVPLNNLAPEAVADILDAARRLLAGEGWLTYFEYPVLPDLKRVLTGARERSRIEGVQQVKAAFQARERATALVLRNLPPARAVHLRV